MKKKHFFKKFKVVLPPVKNIYITNESIKGIASIPVIEANFLDLVSKAMGFTYDLIFPADGLFGNRLDNGSWTGVVGLLDRNEADMAFAYLSMNYDRFLILDFSTTYTSQVQTFVTEIPPLIPKTTVFMYPFSLSIWFTLLPLVPIVSLIVYYLMTKKRPFLTVFTTIGGSLFKQPVNFTIHTVSYRILYSFWWLFVTFMTMSYSAVFLSFLTVPLREKGVRTVMELSSAVKTGSYKALLPKGSSLLNFLLESEYRHLQELGQIIQDKNWFYDTREKITNYFEAKTALLGPNMRFKGSLYRKMRISEDSFGVWNVGVVLNKKYCCKKRLNEVIFSLISAGLYEKIINDEIFRSGIGTDLEDIDEPEKTHSLNLGDMYGIFILLFAGYLVSSIVLVAEIALHRILKFRRITYFNCSIRRKFI
ncbi:glutamate receptor ionotropic, kainate 1-like [Argiope bruennichi]|uniref:glutamate receptor ionotropic, kainate 1-like n=1 Tax=Argiope bruennichi TaxID=94029 RepID=UPI00249599A6|nr:glutamate receptor ionotropic, kainate 1-like [Argiope bruennichi]